MGNLKEVEKARELLKRNGFFVDNLWSVDDVKSKFNCTDEQAMDVLNSSLTNVATMSQIWTSIGIFGEIENLEKIKEEEL